MTNFSQKKIICIRCKAEKLGKYFQRDSKEYKSCNECCYRARDTINDCFAKAAKLMDAAYYLRSF